jgi:L-fuconolactonase
MVAARRVDAHKHFWRLARNDYAWMAADGPHHRNYLPADYLLLGAGAGIGGAVLLQAAPTVAETEYMLGTADAEPKILGVVGWFDLEDAAAADLRRLATHPKLIGVRPMIQDIADDKWVTRPAVLDGLKRLAGFGLTFDLLCYPRHLPYAIRTLDKVPDLKVVVDHLAKPDYASLSPEWCDDMKALAARPNICCKLAGLVTEIGPEWRKANFSRHVETVFDLFGPGRLMIGSDWPVLTKVASFADVISHQLIAGFSTTEQNDLWAGTVARFLWPFTPGLI